jgi:hypothetical protein
LAAGDSGIFNSIFGIDDDPVLLRVTPAVVSEPVLFAGA